MQSKCTLNNYLVFIDYQSVIGNTSNPYKALFFYFQIWFIDLY